MITKIRREISKRWISRWRIRCSICRNK